MSGARRLFPRWVSYLCGGLAAGVPALVAGCIWLSLQPWMPENILEQTPQQRARMISYALYQWAWDNNWQYPEGESSTEIFRHLNEGMYLPNPEAFYYPLPGKIKGVEGERLKPENVCFDVTMGVEVKTRGSVPFVFLTGYKVTYAAGTPAVPLMKPYPRYRFDPAGRSWKQWMFGFPTGIAVAYADRSCAFLKLVHKADGASVVPDFVPAGFDAQGRTYRQLGPEGEVR